MFPGKLDTFLENQAERIEHDRRVNETVRTKQKQLEKFIAKNKDDGKVFEGVPIRFSQCPDQVFKTDSKGECPLPILLGNLPHVHHPRSFGPARSFRCPNTFLITILFFFARRFQITSIRRWPRFQTDALT